MITVQCTYNDYYSVQDNRVSIGPVLYSVHYHLLVVEQIVSFINNTFLVSTVSFFYTVHCLHTIRYREWSLYIDA